MKRYNTLWLLLSLTLLRTAAPAQRVFSLEEAAAEVCQFEGIPDLRLRYIGLDWEKRTEGWGDHHDVWVWPTYVLGSDDSRPEIGRRYGYNVDPYAGQVLKRVDYQIKWWTKERNPESTDRMLPPPTVVEKAVAFLKRYNPVFLSDEFEMEVDFDGGLRSYSPAITYKKYFPLLSVYFRKYVMIRERYRVYVPGQVCRLGLDSETGEVAEYWGVNYPLRAPLAPKISEEDAKRIAVGYFNRPGVLYAFAAELWPRLERNASFPDCLVLLWRVNVRHLDRDMCLGDWQPGESTRNLREDGVLLNAQTGEILQGDNPVFWIPPPVTPSLQEVEEFRRTPRVIGGIRISVNGHSVIFSPPPLQRQGRWYVKSTFAWLLGVRGEEEAEGYRLEGVKMMRVPSEDLHHQEGSLWIPLDQVVAAAEGKFEWHPAERWLEVQGTYPPLSWPKQ